MSPIKLTIEISGPLDPDDRDLLSGVAVMTLAIANHEMAKRAFPETFGDEEEEEDEETRPPDERAHTGDGSPAAPQHRRVRAVADRYPAPGAADV